MSVGLLGKVHRWIRRGGGAIPSSVLPYTVIFYVVFLNKTTFFGVFENIIGVLHYGVFC